MKRLIFGECIDVMKNIESKSIDLIICDPPYGITKNSWDKVIPINEMFEQYNRIIKDTGTIIIFGIGKFSASIILADEKYKYSLIWEKSNAKGFLNAKKRPLSAHEDIHIFQNKKYTYNPQKTSGHKRKVSTSKHKINCKKTENYNNYNLSSYDSTERYPRSVLKFSNDTQRIKLHPTQKPEQLIDYLIKTYSNVGDLILDNCAGSGTTGVCADKLSRDFILIENDFSMIEKIEKRIGAIHTNFSL